MKELPKAYIPADYEKEIYQKWESSGYFNPDNLPVKALAKAGQPFSMALPPPNATGVLHLGHVVMCAVQDLLARFNRMQGKKVLWLPGTDHAAIATQNVVEKQLWEEGKKTRFDFDRDEFVKKVADFAANSRQTIQQQLRAAGASLDWSRERYTLDESISGAVKEMFVRMYHDGLIYRGNRIVNWCYRCGTTLADDEVEYKESLGKLYYINYGPVTVATTRPETKIGDTALAVNPEDGRYKKMIGQKLEVTLGKVKVKVKVIADKIIDPTFGTGVVGVTPAHSLVDFDLAQKYHLPLKEIIGTDGKMTAEAGAYAGLTVKQTRQQLLADLGNQVEKIEDYKHNLSICYRCGTPVEPLISKQWFVAVDKPFKAGLFKKTTLKKLAIAAVKSGQIKIVPEKFNKVYYHWMENLHDWCISRQIWFGHRIPVWYCKPQDITLRMGWHESVMPQLYKGKTKTYRLRDHGFKVGDKVLFDNSQTEICFGYGIITEVKETTVENIDYRDKTHYKTYNNLSELIEAFKRRNPDKVVTPQSQAYLYAYEFHPFSKHNTTKRCGNIIVSNEAPKECPTCGNKKLEQDPDTLDTWFSSGTWTFSTLGWPNQSTDLKTYHPTDVLETSYDILFFWVARMIMMTQYALKQIPFRHVYLHGLVRDKQGRKMSKSLGNGIDPREMITKYGADALRLSMLVGNTPGNDFKLYEEKIAGYRNFINKLWNISRFILLTIKDLELTDKPQAKTLADKWILSHLENITTEVTNHLNKFEFSPAAEKLYDFTWHELADWYLEIAKIEGEKDKILTFTLQTILKLWHPFTPFVTETLWQEAFSKNGLLMIQSWPKASEKQDKEAEQDMKIIQDIVTAIRNYRAEQKIPSDQVIECAISSHVAQPLIQEQQHLLAGLRTKIKLTETFAPSWQKLQLPLAVIYLKV
ncbi:MAG: valine--tRNA ligase [Patescibacteria group bacterium]